MGTSQSSIRHSFSEGGASIALEQFLAGKGFAKKAGAVLLTGSGARLLRASDLATRRSLQDGPASSQSLLPALDALLKRGLSDHRLVEIVGCRSSGRFSIALAALASATGSGQDAALIDLGDELDPQAAQEAGVDLARLLWVRPRRVKEALAAAEMLLATGLRLVVVDMGLSPRGGRFLPDASWVRLARSAETQGSTLVLSAPYRMSGIAADAVVSAAIPRPIWRGVGRAPRLLSGISSRLTLEKCGRVTPGHSATLDLSVPEAVSSQLSAISPTRSLRSSETFRTSSSPSALITNHKSPAFAGSELASARRPITNLLPNSQFSILNS